MTNDNISLKWNQVIEYAQNRFGTVADMEILLFLIGLQELNLDYRKYSKDQKMDIMHIAVCKLFSQYGYYEYLGYDKDGWPHYLLKEALPNLNTKEQEVIMKQAIIEYFEVNVWN